MSLYIERKWKFPSLGNEADLLLGEIDIKIDIDKKWKVESYGPAFRVFTWFADKTAENFTLLRPQLTEETKGFMVRVNIDGEVICGVLRVYKNPAPPLVVCIYQQTEGPSQHVILGSFVYSQSKKKTGDNITIFNYHLMLSFEDYPPIGKASCTTSTKFQKFEVYEGKELIKYYREQGYNKDHKYLESCCINQDYIRAIPDFVGGSCYALPRACFYLDAYKTIHVHAKWLLCNINFQLRLKNKSTENFMKETRQFLDGEVDFDQKKWSDLMDFIVEAVTAFITRLPYTYDSLRSTDEESILHESFSDKAIMVGSMDCEDGSFSVHSIFSSVQENEYDSEFLVLVRRMFDWYISTNAIVTASTPKIGSTCDEPGRFLHMASLLVDKRNFIQRTYPGMILEKHYLNKRPPFFTGNLDTLVAESTAEVYCDPEETLPILDKFISAMKSIIGQGEDLKTMLTGKNIEGGSEMYHGLFVVATDYFYIRDRESAKHVFFKITDMYGKVGDCRINNLDYIRPIGNIQPFLMDNQIQKIMSLRAPAPILELDEEEYNTMTGKMKEKLPCTIASAYTEKPTAVPYAPWNAMEGVNKIYLKI